MDETTTMPGVPIEDLVRLSDEASPGCIEFLRDLVTLPSPSRCERLACERVLQELERLGYEDAHIDPMGNVLGRLGNGPRVLAFDAHVDTVGITNPAAWKYDPFRGVISGGTLYGRGASDQKGGLAAVVHGVAILAQVGVPEDVTVWVTATVNGEDCVGLAWQYLIREAGLRPEAVVIAMASHLGVCRGQRGRMELEISTYGVSTHGSQPERGANAIYGMAPVITGLARLHTSLETSHPLLGRGSVAVTQVSSRSASVTAIPDECTVHVDRRVTLGECCERVMEQLQELPEVAASGGSVRLLDYDLPSWRGLVYPTEQCFPAWETPEDAPAVSAAMTAARRVLGRAPALHRSAFSSHGCATAGMFGIPTVGFGPADEVHSHSSSDQISLVQLKPAMAFYALFPSLYLEAAR